MLNTKMIGNKIAEARKKTNISQAQLAEGLFISSQAVGKWERGESMPDIITLNRLAEILKVDLNYFSESFRSVAVPTEPLGVQTGEMPPVKQMKNLNTDMSGWNYAAADFSGTDLTGSSFRSSDLREANFDRANLTNCNFSTLDLAGASFNKSTLVGTSFSKSGLDGTKFTDINLVDVRLTMVDLRKTIFENCVFSGVDFEKSDMRGLCLDGQTFTGVSFDNAALNEVSFRGATLRNVSFRSPYALTNKYYRALKTICFEGAVMDKLLYALLKGMEIDLSKVTVV